MITKTDIVTGRFAPSPTGRMHLGNVFSALLSWLSAKSQGGRWLLRIEDLDRERCRPDYVRQLLDDLLWLGLEWDGEPVYQSLRHDIYLHYFQFLHDKQLTYPCYCSRADLLASQAPHESDGRAVYQGTCRHLPPQPGRAAAMRLIVPDDECAFTDGHYGVQRVNLAHQVGDFIIRRKDGAWAYQLAVVIDDALMGVTEVVRGRDLLLSAAQQIYVSSCLGFTPPCFTHLPLLLGTSGQRLSKRDRAMDLGVLRQKYSADDIIGFLAFIAGLQPEPAPLSAADLVPHFAWQRVPTRDIVIKDEELPDDRK